MIEQKKVFLRNFSPNWYDSTVAAAHACESTVSLHRKGPLLDGDLKII